MRSSSRVLPIVLTALLPVLAHAAPPVTDYFVPSVATPTIQSAVNAAVAAPATLSRIFLTQSPVHCASEILIGTGFDFSHRLLIRPGSTLGRATIVGDNTNQPIIHFIGAGQAGYATFQDLDVVREITNNHHLIELTYAFTNITFERCRIGSTDTGLPGGSPGWSMVEMSNPVHVVFRNCVLFALPPGTFEQGFHVTDFATDAGSLYLYNNDIADYSVYGIHITDPALTHPGTIVLRNNVLANSPVFPATSEPTAFFSEVLYPTAIVRSSGNAVFGSAARVQSLPLGALSLVGGDLDLLARDALGDPADSHKAFQQSTWDALQGYDANPFFFHLWPSGALHNGLEDVGTTVANGAPDVEDIAVFDDIDRDARPSGAGPGHTDRGADQSEKDNTGVGGEAAHLALAVAPGRNPATELALRFRAGAAGQLRLEAYDLAGRRVASLERRVAAGETGDVRTPAPPGVLQYRLELVPDRGVHAVVSGRAVILR